MKMRMAERDALKARFLAYVKRFKPECSLRELGRRFGVHYETISTWLAEAKRPGGP